MRRVLGIALALGAVAALVAARASGDGEGTGGDYLVRAYFDNAGFLVDGEDVRIAGATVGTVSDVDVSLPGEAVTENGDEDPGKAAVALRITDPGFQDFLTDASCLIRPQSLLGEKYVECAPTQPRAPGSEPPPALKQIPDGEIGEGQYFLPLENNGKAVDLDLVNNITREPEVDRFRLILNDLGAGLAARGPDLAEVIERANPALQQTDKVLAIARRAEQAARPARRGLRHRSSPRSPASASTSPASSATPRSPARPPPSAATTSSPASTTSRPPCASCRARWSSCAASPSRRRRWRPTSARPRPA